MKELEAMLEMRMRESEGELTTKKSEMDLLLQTVRMGEREAKCKLELIEKDMGTIKI
jgi:uncharacterized protein YprB with RNaseH-like and TPR domain